ncbi:MAG: TolC family protein [Saprospiraceae bacterium]|nr:TolC family protein [Saprospiraceae bacterium]
MKKIKILTGLLLFVLPVFSQKIITPDAAIQAALQNHPSVKAATFGVQAKKYEEKTALNLPNPEVNVESPTGEFYAVGVLQSFEFPTVYSRQKQVAKAETALAQASQRVSENDLRYMVRSLYLETQVAEFQAQQWRDRDTLYQQIAATAARQFASGEIDFLQKTLVENEAGKVHQERVAVEITTSGLYVRLRELTGLNDLASIQPLSPDTIKPFSPPGSNTNPAVLYEQQIVQVAESQVKLAKSRALPNFSLGYLNQGVQSTPIDYRFRASVGIPLWAGQYRAGRQAAESEAQAAQSRAEAQTQVISLEQERIVGEHIIALNQVDYYQREALPRSRALIDAAVRMREAGQVDYVTFLRTLDEAYAIQRDYVAQVNALNTAHIQLLYLYGQ